MKLCRLLAVMSVGVAACGGASLVCPPDATQVGSQCVCPPDTAIVAGACTGQKQVPCTPLDSPPMSSSSDVSGVVTVTYANGMWSVPDSCGWVCDAGYCRGADMCTPQYQTFGHDPTSGVWIGTYQKGDAARALGQGFVAPTSFSLARVEFFFAVNAGPDCWIDAHLRKQDGTPIVSARRKMDPDQTMGWVPFEMVASITEGTTYYLTLFVEETSTSEKCTGSVGTFDGKGLGLDSIKPNYTDFLDWASWSPITANTKESGLAFRLDYGEQTPCTP